VSLRILADENVDRQVVERLTAEGIDIEHVDRIEALGKGAGDSAVATYSTAHDRLLLTNDDDFLRELPPDDRPPILLCASDSFSSRTVAEIVLRIDELVEHDEIQDLVYVTRRWL